MKSRTPGPWKWSDEYKTTHGQPTWSLLGADGFGILSCDGMPNSPQNIRPQDAAAIIAIPDLIDALTALIPLAYEGLSFRRDSKEDPDGEAVDAAVSLLASLEETTHD